MRHFASAVLFLISALAFGQAGPDSVVRGTKQFRQSELVSGLAGPWELTWGPDNFLWVTERTGKRVTRIDPKTGERKVAITIAEVSAPGAQDGLLGMALQLPFVYVAYTYVDEGEGADPTVADPRSPYRYLYTKIVRLSYDRVNGTLSNPVNIITGLPAGNDHVSGRLKIGPDRKLYLTLGDQGNDQGGNYCLPIQAQRLPTQAELGNKDYVAYVGKSLRLNLDGSVPSDNPKLDGVRSHVFTYGHRNMQGIDFGPDGTLYASEHGPKTDDEVNILKAGSNYGWPHVAGKKDGKAYEFARWADSSTPCSQMRFSDIAIPASVPRAPESAFTKTIVEPIATMFTVADSHNFQDPTCRGVDFICWPTVGASNLEFYASKKTGIPGWDRMLLVTTLKRGSLYVAALMANGKAVAGPFNRYFQSENRYRDTAISPDGRTVYIATDPDGTTEALGGGTTRRMKNAGAILAFTYEGEGPGAAPQQVSTAITSPAQKGPAAPTTAPQLATKQSAAGKTAYDANCAACHGSTLTNGTFAPPLAGEAFRQTWSGQPVGALNDRVRTMPPSAPGSLAADTYVNIAAYILEVNGSSGGAATIR